jgi:hypothetical protein
VVARKCYMCGLWGSGCVCGVGCNEFSVCMGGCEWKANGDEKGREQGSGKMEEKG